MKHENEIALISGITGYMATWVAKKLLEEGYRVRGTYRSEKRLPYIKQLLPGVELVQTDLNSDAGWDDAFKDVTAFFHVASPQAVATEHDRTGTAMKGVDNVFAAAFRSTTLRKIVLTSSEAAVAYGKQNKTVYNENDWTNVDARGLADYMKSKTVEEHRAWELINDQEKNSHAVKMAVINPAFVLGPSLVPWARYSAIQMKQLLQIPFALPMQGYAVDVRDVAAMQVALMQNDDADGTRNLAMGMPMSMADVKRIMVTDFREQGIRSAMIPIPAWLLLPLRGTTSGADFYPRFKGQVTYQPLHPEFYQYQHTNLRVSVDEMMTQLLKDKQIGPQQGK